MARSHGRKTYHTTTHPFREPPYHRVGAEAELAESYERMLGADPQPELGLYEATPIPRIRHKAIPPAHADEEQHKLPRPASRRMQQRRQAKKSTHRKINPFMVTTGGQAVPWGDQEASTWAAIAKHTQRHESEGRRYVLKQLDDGFWHVVDAKTGASTGKYASTPSRGQEILGKMLRRTNPYRSNPSPVPGISVEEVIADVDGQEWANWDLNRAGIMHWRGNPRR